MNIDSGRLISWHAMLPLQQESLSQAAKSRPAMGVGGEGVKKINCSSNNEAGRLLRTSSDEDAIAAIHGTNKNSGRKSGVSFDFE